MFLCQMPLRIQLLPIINLLAGDGWHRAVSLPKLNEGVDSKSSLCDVYWGEGHLYIGYVCCYRGDRQNKFSTLT